MDNNFINVLIRDMEEECSCHLVRLDETLENFWSEIEKEMPRRKLGLVL